MPDTGGRNISTDVNGDVHVGKGLVLGDSVSTTDGALRVNGGNLELYNGGWGALGGGGGGGGGAVTSLQQASALIYTMDEPSGNLTNSAPFAALLNLDGTLSGGDPPVRVADSPVATSPNSLDFPAASYVNIANPASIPLDRSRQAMLQFWYKGSSDMVLVQRSNGGVDQAKAIYIRTISNNLWVYMTGYGNRQFAHGSLSNGAWHHIQIYFNAVIGYLSVAIDSHFIVYHTYNFTADLAHTLWLGEGAGVGTCRLADVRYTEW